MNFRNAHGINKDHQFKVDQKMHEKKLEVRIDEQNPIFMAINEGKYIEHHNDTFYNMFYIEEQKRGFEPEENHAVPGRYEIEIEPNEEKEISFICSTEDNIEELDARALIMKETVRLHKIFNESMLIDNSKVDEAKDEILKTFEVQIPYEGPLENDRAELILEDVLNAEQMHSEALKDMPDKSITQKDMEAYGYSYDNMLPLTKEVADKLFDVDAVIYMLHYDNTETMVLDKNDITNHDGIFGIEKADWAAVKDNYLKNAEMSTEDDYDMIDGIINNGDNKPTVAELEEAAKNGKPISVLDLAEAVKDESKDKIAKFERPSLLAKLQRPLPEKKNTEKPKSKEREM